jgi:hypothetical protein
MPIETSADRRVFLSAEDFGCVFSYQPRGSGPVVENVPGIFDNDALPFSGDGDGAAVLGVAPRLTCAVADLYDGGHQGDRVTLTATPSQPEFQGRKYRVVEARGDGTGMALLFLEREL